MMQRSEVVPVAARPQALLAMATVLARKGRFSEATSVIARAREHEACPEVEALDLQARIFAQQGLRLDAEACWRKAGALAEDGRAYEAQLVRLRRPQRTFGLIPLVLLVAGLAVLGWQVTAYLDKSAKATLDEVATLRSNIAASNSVSEGAIASLQGLEKALQGLEARLAERIATLPDVVAKFDPKEAVAGVRFEIDRIGRQIEALPTVQSAKDQHGAVTGSVEKLSSEIRTLKSEINRARAEIDAVGRLQRQTTKMIRALQ